MGGEGLGKERFLQLSIWIASKHTNAVRSLNCQGVSVWATVMEPLQLHRSRLSSWLEGLDWEAYWCCTRVGQQSLLQRWQHVTQEKEVGSTAPFLAHTDHQVQVAISYLGLLRSDSKLNTSPFLPSPQRTLPPYPQPANQSLSTLPWSRKLNS